MGIDSGSRILGEHLKSINRHLAVKRPTLKELLKDEKPNILLQDGDKHYLRKKELEEIGEILPEEYHDRLRLPVYIEMSSSKYGRGTARVAGYPECLLLAKVLEKEFEGDTMFVYKPEIRILRKKFPTTTQYMFTISLND